FLEQQDVAFAAPCQRKGNRAADRPATHDDDARMTIEGPWHRSSRFPLLMPEPRNLRRNEGAMGLRFQDLILGKGIATGRQRAPPSRPSHVPSALPLKNF